MWDIRASLKEILLGILIHDPFTGKRSKSSGAKEGVNNIYTKMVLYVKTNVDIFSDYVCSHLFRLIIYECTY